MLYDPKWEAKTEATPSLGGFIAWLERQPATGRYRYMPCLKCAIGQYMTSIGTTYCDQVTPHFDMLSEWNIEITGPLPQTFGAALKRARALAVR